MSDAKQQPKKTAHAPRKIKSLPWSVSRHCGLVYLHNERTDRAIKEGCDK